MHGKQLRKLEAELWRAADQLRANSKLTASEYSMPVLGLIFFRHAYNRFQKVKIEVEKTLPSHPQRGKRPLTKKDFEEQNSMFLPDKAQFDYLVSLPESADIGEAIDNAMKLIEDEYDNLKGVLPKNFSIFSKDLLRELLRIFNKEVLQKAEGDLFGKIYEYFLNKFSEVSEKEIEQVELYVPECILKLYVEVIEPDGGIVFDPICGSARTLVETGKYLYKKGLKPAEKVTFYGQEKADLNTKLAKMNLAVHGLEGNIQEGNTFYEDKHDLVGGADFVMANPPFNVDGVDKAKDAVKKDPRLILAGKVNLPKNDNANYLWIQYFYNYLKPPSTGSRGGRAGFVMASSASDAGHSEKDIREKLVKTGAVDVMMAIGNNFFYTRSLPCTLWFFDRGKELLIPGTSPQGEGSRSIVTVEHQLPKQLLENARELRKNQTEAEELLWQLLRNRQLGNLKFRRQHPLKAGFILDFFCAEAKLGIEIDGGYHNQKEQQEYDAERTKIINEYGIHIIRFTNEKVLLNTEQVLYDIATAATPPSPSGERLGVRNKNTVLMLDARKIYRKVTSKVNDFSPEQLQSLICIVNLYRGTGSTGSPQGSKKFESTVKSYLQTSADLAKETAEATTELQEQLQKVFKTVSNFATKYAKENKEAKAFVDALNIEETARIYEQQNDLIDFVNIQHGALSPLQFGEGAGVRCKMLRKPQDKLIKQLLDAISTAAKEYQLNRNKDWKALDVQTEHVPSLKALQQQLSGNPDEEEPGLLHETEYFYKQAQWLTSRFPEGVYTDVEGLCKVVTQQEIEAKDWSLSPGRYVGVSLSEDEDIDYEARLNEIHIELEGLNEEAAELAKLISENYKQLT